MVEVISALRREHRDMAKLLNALERQLAAFDRGDRPDYEIVQAVIDYCLTYPDLSHHPREDLVFERLRARDPETAESIGNLQAEHEALAERTRRFAAAVSDVLLEAEMPRDALHKVAWDFLNYYRKHISMEETRFFPAALEALKPEDWRAIESEADKRGDPLFGEEPEEHFKALRRNILDWDRNERAAAAEAS